MLTHEPRTGVGIISAEGRIHYLNDQAARIFHGPAARAADYIGRTWDDHMPAEWIEERRSVLRHIQRTGTPVLMRTIWRGYQHFTWVYPVRREHAEPEMFLTLTRRTDSDAEAEQLVSTSEYTWLDSNVATLGPLDVLSDRELEVLALLGQGLSIEDAARALYRSPETIKSHRRSIGEKLHISGRSQLVKVAARAGLRLDDARLTRLDGTEAE